MAARPTTRTFSWREFVEKNDDENRHKDNLYPVTYKFQTSRVMRDSGPTKGIYESGE